MYGATRAHEKKILITIEFRESISSTVTLHEAEWLLQQIEIMKLRIRSCIRHIIVNCAHYDIICQQDYVFWLLSARMDIKDFLIDEVEITLSDQTVTILRQGWRSTLNCVPSKYDLAHCLAGQIPYFYRSPDKIAEDFISRANALEIFVDLATKAPTSPKFQQSHCGEIIAALYLENVLGFRRLYSKLTLTTSENTNVHKMDGFFVDTRQSPYTYIAVEAKSSIRPTEKSGFSGHRYGILKQIIESLQNYDSGDKRFDLTVIRDNLEKFAYSAEEQTQIKKDLMPPGPEKLVHIGMATINESTVSEKDDIFILCEPCIKAFTYRSVVVADLSELVKKAYGLVHELKKAGGG